MNYNVDDTFQVDKISSIPVETLIQIIEIVSVDTFERLNGDKAPSEGCQKVLSAQRMVSIRQFVGLRTSIANFSKVLIRRIMLERWWHIHSRGRCPSLSRPH